jgi:CysZ protein
VSAAFFYQGALTSSLWDAPTGDDLGADVARFGYAILEVLILVLLVLAAFLCTLLVSGIVSAPFNARLAEVLDERVTGRVAPPFAVGRALRDVARQIVIETTFFAGNATLVLLSLIVPALSPVTGALGLVFGALYFGISYLEAPQATRERTLRDRLDLVRAHPMALLGFGAGVGLFLFVPLVNLLFMPAAVAGGVLLHAALEDESPPA